MTGFGFLSFYLDGFPFSTSLASYPYLNTLRKDLVVQQDASNAQGHRHLGVVASRLSDMSEAAASLRRAVALQPDDDDALHELGNVFSQMGHVDEAEAVLRDLLSREPPQDANSPPSNAKLALAHLLLDGRGHRAEALAVYRAAASAARPSPFSRPSRTSR